MPTTASEELPLRSDIFDIEHLQVLAKVVAGWHELARVPGSNQLLNRLADNAEGDQPTLGSVDSQLCAARSRFFQARCDF